MIILNLYIIQVEIDLGTTPKNATPAALMADCAIRRPLAL
jgi:hypothetical protein